MTTCLRADAGACCNYPFLTSKERDIETGLDYFLARYYSSAQGRFTSVDPVSAINYQQTYQRSKELRDFRMLADRQELVAAFARSSIGDPSADWLYMPENLTVRQTESRAYRVSAFVGQGLGNSLSPGGYEVWNTGWRAADRSANMQKGIKELLTKSSLYKDKLNDRIIKEK